MAIPQFLIKGFPPKEDPKLSFEGNKSPREKERESVANLIRGSYNGPQYIVTLQSPESVAKHSIFFSIVQVHEILDFVYFSISLSMSFITFYLIVILLSFSFSLCFSLSLSLSQVYLWSLVSVLNIQTGSQTMTFNFYHQQLKYTNNLFVIVLIWVEQICQLIQFCSLIQIWAYFRINTLSTYIILAGGGAPWSSGLIRQ